MRIAIALMTAGALYISGSSYAQKVDFGKSEYDSACAACHGKLGKGDGPYGGVVYTPIPDLTTLAKKNNGVFPFQWIYEIIDGRQTVKGHGPKDMPIWGGRYLAIAGEHYFDVPYDPEAVVRTRILALAEYINRLQIK